MICPFCRKEFLESDAEKVCQACSLFGGCKNTKCPYCDYEFPQEPALVKKFRNIRNNFRRSTSDRR
jgi:hypothetical protein